MKQNFLSDLKTLINHQWLREDTLFIGRISNFCNSKEIRNTLLHNLLNIQQERTNKENLIVQRYNHISYEVTYKPKLYKFNSSIMKIVKVYHLKTHNLSPILAQMCQTSIFLNQLRVVAIEYLSECDKIGGFLQNLLKLCRKRFEKQLFRFNYQLLKQEWIKNNKYLDILQPINLQFALCYLQKGTTSLPWKKEDHRQQKMREILDLHQDAIVGFNFSEISNIGICDFIITKITRIIKDLKNKNQYNQEIIQNNLKKYTLPLKNSNKFAIAQQISTKPRKSLYRIHPININNSKSVRPLSQQNQNNSQKPLRQTLMEIHIDNKMFISKIIKTRKKLPLVLIRAYNNFH